jgi:hypothetical protein
MLWGLLLLLIPVGAYFDWRGRRPEQLKRRAAEWLRSEYNPHHVPLDPNAWMTRHGNLTMAAGLVLVMVLLVVISRLFPTPPDP